MRCVNKMVSARCVGGCEMRHGGYKTGVWSVGECEMRHREYSVMVSCGRSVNDICNV